MADVKGSTKIKKSWVESSIATSEKMQKIINESNRVVTVAHHSKQALDIINAEFESQTKLNKKDIAFLFFATALQCVRQYLITGFTERVNDQTAAKTVKEHIKEHSNRMHSWYNPSLEEVITNPVPFDAMYGSPDFELGLSGVNHRTKTLGHDPILGWIFGTANIATSTITTWDLKRNFPPLASYHVMTGFTKNGAARDKITKRAKTALVLNHTKSKIVEEGISKKAIVGAALIKEAIHLKTDIKSFKSLPIPILYSLSPEIAKELASYGVDTGSLVDVGKQATYAILINTLIGMIHRLCYNKMKDKSLGAYSVRTHKLITYSNLIASTSNVLYVAFNVIMGNETAIKKLDVGGFLVTIYRLINDRLFISKIKEEFIKDNFNILIKG